MNRLLTLGATAALALAGSGIAADSLRAPSLKLVGTSPAKVVGAGFATRERIRVTAAGRTLVARADRLGRFTLVFQSVTVDRCGVPFVVRAIGAAGSEARVKLPPLPDCPLPG